LTTVLCIVAGTKDDPRPIGVRACVEAQRERCFCLKGVPALQAVGPELEPATGDDDRALSKKRKLREELSVLRARCQGFLRKPPSQQYAGPAIAAAAGTRLEQPLSSSVPLPAPPSAKAKSANAGGASMPPGPGKPAHPELDEREDWHEAAIAAQELGEDRPASVRKGEPGSLTGGAHAGRMSRDTSESAANGVRRQPAGEERTVHLSNRTTERTLTPTEKVGAEVAGARQVPNVPTDDRRPQVGVGSRRHRRCRSCSGPVERRNSSGYCAKRDCQKELFKEKEVAKPKCSVEACTRRAFGPSGKCSDCQNGVRPGSGLDPCATVGCPKRVQRWRKFDRCTYCRRGLTHHLVSNPKELSMAKPNPLDAVSEADFKAAFQKHRGQFKATGKALGAAGSTVKRRAAELGLLGKRTGQPPPPFAARGAEAGVGRAG
jgi:hypothetical protein